METKSLSLREFNKKILKKREKINMEKIYQDDNYLIQTLKRTKRITIEKPEGKLETNLEKILKKIYTEIKFLKDSKIEEINKENNKFKLDYFTILERFQNTTSKTFHDLINLYKIKGYKIPTLNYNHNLFKVNPLIEENTNKIIHYFLTQKNVRTKKEILLLKSLLFLNKLNKLIIKNNNKTKKYERRKSVYSLNKKNNSIENIENLKKNIEEIFKLGENINLLENNDSNCNTIKNKQKIKTLDIIDDIRNISKKENELKTLTSRNQCNSFRNSITNKIGKFRNSLRLNTHGNSTNFDESYILDKNTITINDTQRRKSDKETKRMKKILLNSDENTNKYSHIKNKNNSFLRNTIINKQITVESKIKGSYKLHTLNNEKRNKYLNLNLQKNNFSKTLTHLNKIRKDKKRTESQPLFIRTQTSEKKLINNYNFEKKNDLDIKRRNLSFLNKKDFMDYTYKRLKKGNFENIDKYIKLYLNEIECKNNEESEIILSKYDYKNFKYNLSELENFIRKSEVDRKTEKIYFNNFISKRIMDSLENMREKEAQIFKFNKIISTIGNTNK